VLELPTVPTRSLAEYILDKIGEGA
jgi:hypothetical protein